MAWCLVNFKPSFLGIIEFKRMIVHQSRDRTYNPIPHGLPGAKFWTSNEWISTFFHLSLYLSFPTILKWVNTSLTKATYIDRFAYLNTLTPCRWISVVGRAQVQKRRVTTVCTLTLSHTPTHTPTTKRLDLILANHLWTLVYRLRCLFRRSRGLFRKW